MKKLFTAVVCVALSAPVFATAPAFPDVASGVDYTAVGTQAGTLALAVAGVYVIFKGARMLLSFLRGS